MTAVNNRRRMARGRLVGVIAIGLVLAASLSLAVWYYHAHQQTVQQLPSPEAPADPRLTYAGPFLNVHPDVAYVGDATCADCHQDIAAAFRRSSMGRSLRPIAAVAPRQRYDASAHNPFTILGYEFRVDRQGNRVQHRQRRTAADGTVLLDFALDVHYVIGSGTRGYSYITDRDGYLFQTPISWYSQKQIWDKSPGFDATRFAGQTVLEACLYCHANQAFTVEDYENRYERPFALGHAIGCERCHGPGQRHVTSGGTMLGGFDPTIVNPRKLPPALRAAVCQQCHLEGKSRILRRGRRQHDFRPGLPLQSVFAVFEYADTAGDKAVAHVEQMALSACYRGSSARQPMDCTTCHDPHRQVAPHERVAFYRQRCLQCHDDHACHATAEARAARHNSCSDCHMPRFQSGDIAHTASTDHRIIRPGRAPVPAPALAGRLEAFLPRDAASTEVESARDLGIALVETARTDAAQLARALALLDEACARFPTDVAALEARGDVLFSLGKPRRAAEALQQALIQRPRRESALIRYASLCEAIGDDRAALDAWRQLAEVNPYLPFVREHLVAQLIKQRAWGELRVETDAWLRLDPSDLEAHKAWILVRVKTGARADANAAFARALVLHPFSRAALQAWFEDIQP